MTRKVFCGDIQIGGGAPVSIQSMTNVDTRDVAAAINQIDELVDAGCEIVRLAIPDMEAADAFAEIKARRRAVPLVADIHFDYRLAVAAIEAGADKIRINPGNIGSAERVQKVVDSAKERGIPIRIGVNSGSLEKDILQRHGGITAEALVESALRSGDFIKSLGFDDIVYSLKSSDPVKNFEAYRLISQKTDAPLHIGVTEAGTVRSGTIKSAVGIGALLMNNIGDTMRVSLTADPVKEVILAREILEAAGRREAVLNIVSCPTCGRTEVGLEALAEKAEQKLRPLAEERAKKGLRPLKVAVMGCAVNGPGEARDADLGVACGHGKGVLFSRGEIVRSLPEDELIDGLVELFGRFD